MSRRYNLFTAGLVYAGMFLQPAVAQSIELTGRLSLLGMATRAELGDAGYSASNQLLMADQQSLRLMLEDAGESSEWSVHMRAVRQNFIRYSAASVHSSDLFRYRKLSGNWQEYVTADRTTRSGYELDRAVYKHRFENVTFAVGRQPIDWGSGRFWQPLNVFGAFAPTDLDTDFKPGIDAAVFDWYPSAFSSLTLAYVPRSDVRHVTAGSSILHYRRQVGESSEIALLGGSVIGKGVAGGSFESEWQGIGWRIEGVHYKADNSAVFWIAGIDYQFEDGTLIAIEWYDNTGGVNSETMLATAQNDPRVVYGLQQHSGRRVLGMAANRDITPLLHGSYSLFISALQDNRQQLTTSLLHQLSLIYSVSNESDLLFSLLFANGKGLNLQSAPQSEFGHIPASATLRYRFYF
ncbi:MAG: hypothetical protein K9M17_07090 [Mariprofundaceae bacterium]|nr:hypothetical protein [Mariprofundaceae bacterium]